MHLSLKEAHMNILLVIQQKMIRKLLGNILLRDEKWHHSENTKNYWETEFCGNAIMLQIYYKTCRILMILKSFWRIGHKKDKEPIRKYIISRCAIASFGKHRKPLGKHDFATTEECVKIPYKTL